MSKEFNISFSNDDYVDDYFKWIFRRISPFKYSLDKVECSR